MFKIDDRNKIVCPKCGAEYLISEIYYPDKLFGYPTNVVRDEDNKITGYTGTPMSFKESYICDFCDNKFNVNLMFDFTAVPVEEYNIFNEDSYVTHSEKK